MIIWRGFGIGVFIIFIICAWIMSYFQDDTTLGNGAFMGWSMLVAAAPTLLLYLALRSFHLKEKELAPGEIATPQENKSKIFTGHSFFFIPVAIWPIIFAGLGGYLVATSDGGSGNSGDTEYVDDIIPDEKLEGELIINFWNPNEDTTVVDTYFDDGSARMHEEIPPFYIRYATYEAGYYSFEFDGYEKEIKVQGAGDLDTNSYNQAWFILDAKVDLLLVDVSDACERSATESDIRAIDWSTRIEERFNGGDLITPVLDASGTDYKYTVIDPGWELPLEKGDNEVIYSLIPILSSKKASDEFLDEEIVNLCF